MEYAVDAPVNAQELEAAVERAQHQADATGLPYYVGKQIQRTNKNLAHHGCFRCSITPRKPRGKFLLATCEPRA